jgi:nitrate/TMAO reductase-like tetraheme cytochrome c subunit
LKLPGLTKKIWTSLGILIILLSLFLLLPKIVKTITSNSNICGYCHYLKLEMLRTSKIHSKDVVECVDCHKNLNFIKEVNIKSTIKTAWIEENCISCHKDILNQIYNIKPTKLIKISHLIHLEENLGCLSCHENIAHDEGNPGTNRPSKENCAKCHLKDISGPSDSYKCIICHQIILTNMECPDEKNY